MANEDYSGLWEIYFEAKEIYGEISQNEQYDYCKNAVLELMERGWICLYWCHEPLTNENLTLVEPEEILNIISKPEIWEAPEKGTVSIRFLTTSEGEKAFRSKFLSLK